MERNEIKTTYLAPKVKVVKVAVERGFAGTGNPYALRLGLLSLIGDPNLESRNTTITWTDDDTWSN